MTKRMYRRLLIAGDLVGELEVLARRLQNDAGSFLQSHCATAEEAVAAATGRPRKDFIILDSFVRFAGPMPNFDLHRSIPGKIRTALTALIMIKQADPLQRVFVYVSRHDPIQPHVYSGYGAEVAMTDWHPDLVEELLFRQPPPRAERLQFARAELVC